MIAICETHGFVRLTRQALTCSVNVAARRCGKRLRRPSLDELRNLGKGAMERAYVAVNVLNRTNLSDPVTRLRGFMWAIEGRKMTWNEAADFLGVEQ